MTISARLQINKIIKWATAISAAVAISMCAFTSVSAYADKISDLEARIKAAKEERENTQGKIDENKQELANLNSTTSSLQGTLNSLNSELKTVSENLDSLEQQIEQKNADIEEIEAALAEAVSIEEEQYASMKIRIRYMYEKRNYALLESLFGAATFADFLNTNDYFEALASYDRSMLEKYRKTREIIEEARSFLHEEKEELSGLHEEALNEQNRVTTLVNRTAGSLSSYKSEIAATEAEMKKQEEELKAQQANITALQAELAEERRLSELANKSAWRNLSQVSFAEGDRKLLANIIYCEAGNQSFQGQVAVGAVIMNRLMSSVFPDTLVGVVYQKNQFSPVRSGRLALALTNDSATDSCYMAADAAMAGQTTVGNCLFFRTPTPGLEGIQIGGHVFY